MPRIPLAFVLIAFALSSAVAAAEELPPLKYNHPGLVVDLHVGLWGMPIPHDWDGDGDPDLLVNCPDVPMNGIWLFENPGSDNDPGDATRPAFLPPVRLGPAHRDITPVYGDDGSLRLLARNFEIVDLEPDGFRRGPKIYPTDRIHPPQERFQQRTRQFASVDYDGDGDADLIAGIGDWEQYGMNFSADSGGWSNAYDRRGRWRPGPLHGYVYLIRNDGSDADPDYADPVRLEAGGEPIDTYGRPAPNFADYDGDGDLDLICGEFLDSFTWFENVGSRTEPEYAAGRRLLTADTGEPIALDLEMIVPVAYDWDRDGDPDLVVGDEDGRIAWVENTGRLRPDGQPQFARPYYFRQQADDVTIGALVTPEAVDWDGDGDTDLVCGSSAGYVSLVENLSGGPTEPGQTPRFAAPVRLAADGQTIRIMAGPAGSVQGPSEVKWGYTTLSAADWDGDGDPDLVVNTIWGKVIWYETIGTDPNGQPLLTAARPVTVAWPGDGRAPMPEGYWWTPTQGELVTQWRTTPEVVDWDEDGRPDLVMLDHEGYLALWRRREDGRLDPPVRLFTAGDGPSVFDQRHEAQEQAADRLRLNLGVAGRGGRVKLALADWDGDGFRDLLVNSRSIDWMKGQTAGDTYQFVQQGPLTDHRLAGHTTSPTLVNFDRVGPDDLLIGAEDGRLYLKRRE